MGLRNRTERRIGRDAHQGRVGNVARAERRHFRISRALAFIGAQDDRGGAMVKRRASGESNATRHRHALARRAGSR